MSTKNRILSILITIVLSVFCLIPLFDFKAYAKEVPKNLYRVYLNGKSIGVIKSKDKLEEYINEEQKELKEEYGVSKVYLPKGLYISEYKTYSANIIKEEDIYKMIKDTEKFTIKGYTVTIKKSDGDIKINILNKKDFENAVTSVVKAFVPEEDLNVYLSGEEVKITTVGKTIENLYIKESLDSGIKIKESYIPSDEKIYTNEKELTKYLLFGDKDSEKKYTVKSGDTVSTIAEKNQLAVEEFLIVNPDIKSENTLLSIGQEVSVALVSPIITIVEEDYVVEEQIIKYETQIQYDNTLPWGSTKIKQEGQDGRQRVTLQIRKENGNTIPPAIILPGTKVLEASIDRIKVIGTMSTTNIDPNLIPDSGDWYWPTLRTYYISSPFGWRGGSFHEGTDITGTGYGSPIFAANNGIVYKVYYDSIGGYQIVIAHSSNIYTLYAHLASQLVVAGQTVTRGQKIGTMGSTGVSTGTHLHFAAYVGIPYRGGTVFNSMSLYR
jgi:murein DD-endopeptidase MepM/ murein hydrolase activator NlpD